MGISSLSRDSTAGPYWNLLRSAILSVLVKAAATTMWNEEAPPSRENPLHTVVRDVYVGQEYRGTEKLTRIDHQARNFTKKL